LTRRLIGWASNIIIIAGLGEKIVRRYLKNLKGHKNLSYINYILKIYKGLAISIIYVIISSIMLTTRKKAKAIKDVQIHKTDTGSPEVQASVLSKKIDELAKHLKSHKKDNHSRRGLLKMVADRQSIIKYLAKKDPKRHKALIKKLDLKK
jgi:small subunit ribosomal protein S15